MVFGYTRVPEVPEVPETAVAVRSPQGVSRASSGQSARRVQTLGNNEGTLASITSLNVDNSNYVSVGDTYVQQTLFNEEVVKARFLCLQFESAVSMRRFRCSLAVFLCWSLIVASSVASYIIIFVWPQHHTRLDIDLWEPWYLRREDWPSMRGYHPQFLHSAVKYVLIAHTGTEYCNDNSTCAAKVREIQDLHLDNGLPDIGANYLVGGNGLVIEGTGGNVRSSLIKGWEDKSISILFIGNYAKDAPDQLQFNYVSILLDVLVHQQVLRENYELFGQCQIDAGTSSPGLKIVKRLKLFPRWNSANASLCYPTSP